MAVNQRKLDADRVRMVNSNDSAIDTIDGIILQLERLKTMLRGSERAKRKAATAGYKLVDNSKFDAMINNVLAMDEEFQGSR